MNSKIKLISFLIIASMLIILMNFSAAAVAETDHSVSLSSNVTGIGKEVVATVALTRYSAESDPIHGLQIDIGNVDTDIVTVVSYSSLISDSSAMSNTASYSQKNSRIRLVYANFSGTLPISNAEGGKMNVFEVKFKINDILETDGQIDLPVTVKIQTSTKQIVLNSVCTIRYERQPVFEIRLQENGGIEYFGFRQVLIVRNDDACIVSYMNTSNGTVEILPAQNNGNGSYTFIAPNGVEEVYVSVKGDYNADGKLTPDDAISLKSVLLGKGEGYDTEMYIYDITGDNEITALDIALINAAANGVISLW